ncbi:hypothetical protein GKQ77_25875 [Streptomyces sp. BG9H]|uniref:Uncharacterized protein n=1 Tax=Streptomyces anatolicus TaxID=2675858 RepID=A0ABS6YU33_9ACTN|nr:hypothetical protein [Streptomyces anatolicus]MBW5424953.1 hypothetical protein [Streptomyces anatolicus]
MADVPFLDHYCALPTRPVGNDGEGNRDRVRQDLEALTAELYVAERFTEYFRRRYPDSEVISQLNLLDANRFRGATEILAKWIIAEYRNEFGRDALKQNIKTQTPGRQLRSDMLGVRAEGTTMVLELVEVTTVGQAKKTEIEDLQHKTDVLTRFVIEPALKEMLALQRAGRVSIGAPTRIEIRRSTWRPSWNELYYPLVPLPGARGNVKYEWICYKPTFRPDGIGKDGLVLYEIHTTALPQGVPVEVLRRVARRLRELENQHQLVLLPAMQQYWDDNAADSRELKKWLAIGLGAALLVTLVVLAWPTAVPLAAGVAEGSGAAAAAGTAEAAAVEAAQLANAVRYAESATKVPGYFERAQAALRPLLSGGPGRGLVGSH